MKRPSSKKYGLAVRLHHVKAQHRVSAHSRQTCSWLCAAKQKRDIDLFLFFSSPHQQHYFIYTQSRAQIFSPRDIYWPQIRSRQM